MSVRPLDFSDFVAQALAFLARFAAGEAARGAFSSRTGGPVDLYGAADAAYAWWILDELEARTTPDDRRAWAGRIQEHQDPATGWFDRSLLRGHGIPHATAFATGALRLLDATPRHPLGGAARHFTDRAHVDAWLDAFSWGQIWTGSHAAGSAAALLDAPDGAGLADGWIDVVLDALAARADPATGLWKRARRDRWWRRPTAIDLGGAAHFWWLFERSGRAIPHAAAALDSVLSLQRRRGLWGSRWLGGDFPHGLDFDALHGIRIAWHALPSAEREARRGAVTRALERYAAVAHEMLTAPGSVDRWFRAPHKLVGTLDALAELELAGRSIEGESRVTTPRRLRSALTAVSWQ